jgi:hypothetical protein
VTEFLSVVLSPCEQSERRRSAALSVVGQDPLLVVDDDGSTGPELPSRFGQHRNDPGLSLRFGVRLATGGIR